MKNYLNKEQLEKLLQEFPSVSLEKDQDKDGNPIELEKPALLVPAGDFLKVMEHLKNSSAFSMDRLANLTAVDYKDKIQGLYHLFSCRWNLWVTVKVDLDRENPVIDSLTGLWPGANFEEREAFDLMGVTYNDHPDLRRILMPDDYPSHPLRKDFVAPVPKVEEGVLKWEEQKPMS